MAWRYYQAGAADEHTLRANRAAFERCRLLPRVLSMLRNEVDLAFALTGCTSPAEVTADLLA
jgi:isopentenyl diphosphate isomerase/L-lactate dehydrogenase-like FMN-dependent dehydrogenase